MKIAFFEICDWEKDYLKESLKGHELLFFEEKLDKKVVKRISDVDVVCIFIYSSVDKNVLNELKNLKAIVTRSTGFNHIDVKECKKKKIKVFNVPDYGQNTVAEHTFALILALSRKIHKSYEKTSKGDFSLDGLTGFDLKDKTIGIIGLGSIGRHVFRMARGFEMKTLGYDVKKDKKLVKKGLKFVSLNKLFKESDIITLHCPLTKKTEHMINKKSINLMKEGVYIINTARGDLIDTNALIKALAKGRIGGAGLDVLEEERIIKEEIQLLSKGFSKESMENLLENHLLLTFDNVIISPHNAFNSKEALDRILDVTVENINHVNKKKGNLV